MSEDGRSPELKAFLDQQREEIDRMYARFSDELGRGYLAQLGPPPKLTIRQRLSGFVWRLRSRLARPLVTLANWLSPGIASDPYDD